MSKSREPIEEWTCSACGEKHVAPAVIANFVIYSCKNCGASLLTKTSGADILHLRTGRRDNLDISRDTDMDGGPIAVFLFTPDMDDTSDHYHIELDLETCGKLHDWLGRFLRDNKRT